MYTIIFLLIFPLGAWAASAGPVIHHELEVYLEPDHGQLRVADTLELPDELSQQPLCWTLQAGLQPRLAVPESILLKPVGKPAGRYERFCLELPSDRRQLALHYAGSVAYPALPVGNGSAPISGQGVYLDGASHWYPRFEEARNSFRMTVHLPADWRAVTQGIRRSREEQGREAVEVWAEDHPQEDIYLIATTFREYRGAAEPAQALVYLRGADDALADRYLEATTRYLIFYSRLLGAYPYGKFALVENFWESGYGMPSFTLLGPRVIRLPFIVNTSYPHEILHNWWGNGVYTDYETGNWAEGLTAYLADYLFQERQGQGAEYRRSALQRYADYVHEQRDFPLSAFRARRHDNEAAQAVGYDKGLLFFHMLRRRLGDKGFVEGLRRFYREHRFQRAGFADLQTAFEAAGGVSLAAEFQQWLTRTGAPALQVGELKTWPEGEGYRVAGILEQTQPGPAYRLTVPLAVQLDRQERAWQGTVSMEDRRLELSLTLPGRPWRLAVDPEFDVMRRLDRGEIPPSLSRIFGAERMLIVLPAAAPEALKAAYQAIARQWAAERGAAVQWDNELEKLPEGQGVWLFGWENRWRGRLAAALEREPVVWMDKEVQVAGQTLSREKAGMVLVACHPDDQEQALGWMAWDNPAALPALARKLPHYGKYSYLAFSGEAAANVLKGQWPVTDSPLNAGIRQWDGAAVPEWRTVLAPRSDLIE